ncbi:MAG: hypothetical protein ACOCP4_03030, partial [Candidatus Woesearchaeota archaeon]
AQFLALGLNSCDISIPTRSDSNKNFDYLKMQKPKNISIPTRSDSNLSYIAINFTGKDISIPTRSDSNQADFAGKNDIQKYIKFFIYLLFFRGCPNLHSI